MKKKKNKKLEFKQIKLPIYLKNNSWYSQWCCKCGLRHIWNFKIHKGDKETEGDYIEINMWRDDMGTNLRKFYEKNTNKIIK